MNSGNAPALDVLNCKSESVCMDDRVGFKSGEARKEFFLSVREASGVQSWDALAELFHIYRSQFQGYQYGKTLLPEKLFNKMLGFLLKEKQEHFAPLIFKKPGNWGLKKEGRSNFEKNKTTVLKRLKKARDEYACKRRILPVDLAVPLSKELCEFIGAIIGDGCVSGHLDANGKCYYHVNITGDSELDRDYLTNRISYIVKNIFNINSRIYFRKNQRAMIANFYSKKIFMILTKRFGFNAGSKTFTVKIPEEILNSKKEFVFSTIRGIFDTDGCVFLDKRKVYSKPYPRITLQIASEPLFLQLKSFLENYFSLYTNHRVRENMYCMEVYGHGQFEKWMQLIGFSNQRHLKKAAQIVKLPAGIEPAITS